MTETERLTLSCRLAALSVFRNLLQDAAVKSLWHFLQEPEPLTQRMAWYGAFVNALSESGEGLSEHLLRLICEDENAYVRAVAKGEKVPEGWAQNAEQELALLSALTELSAQELTEGLPAGLYVPVFENAPLDLAALYRERLAHIDRYGYGIFAGTGMFRVQEGEIIPVSAADTVTLESLVGYLQEREQVIQNTRMLLSGLPAANVLLCGDAGTGKSSTVKAVANAFFDQGLRLIELRKDQLRELPAVMDRIADNPLKFIIFIDDLSFNKNDDQFSMLKAALEGSASAKVGNAVIYATSNRRHIVKESFSDRAGDDVHRMDTMQELISLSDRFGLVVYFSRPAKALYLEIVHELARRAGVQLDPDVLDRKAEAFALAKGNRSGRAAEQFVQSLLV